MSIDALSWAFNLKLPSPAIKLTLLALANYCNEENEAYPSQKTLSKKTCLCERAIRSNIVKLEELGLLSRTGRTRLNGSFTTDLFKINVGQLPIDQRHMVPQAGNAASQRHMVPQPAAYGAGPDPSLTATKAKSIPAATVKERRHVLPEWIKGDTWKKFVAMRNRIRKPLTYDVITLIFEELRAMHVAGHDVNAVLKQSIVNSWAGIFTVKTQAQRRPEKYDARKFVNKHANTMEGEHEKLVN